MTWSARNPAGFVLTGQRATGLNLMEGVLVPLPRKCFLWYESPHEGTYHTPHGRGTAVVAGFGALGHSVRARSASRPYPVEIRRRSHGRADRRRGWLYGAN